MPTYPSSGTPAATPPPSPQEIGPTDPAKIMTVTVYLKPRMPLPPPPDLAASPLKVLTRAAFAAAFGAAPADVAAVEMFAQSAGLTVVSADPGSGAVLLSGTVASLQSAFQVQIADVQANGVTYQQSSGPAVLPAGLASAVIDVAGLSTGPIASPGGSTSTP